MSEIIGSLFGVTADQYERNRQLEQDRMAFELAQADLGTQSSYLLQSGARGLGNVIGRALGGEDPELQRISQRQQMAQGIDFNDPDSLLQAAQQANQMGDSQAAQELYTRSQQVAQAQATLGKTQAETQKALRERAGADPLQQLIRTGKYTPESVGVFAESGNPADLTAVDKLTKPTSDFVAKAMEFGFGEKSSYGGYTPEQVGRVNAALLEEGIKQKAAGAARNTTEIKQTPDITAAIGAFDKLVAPYRETYNSTENAQQLLNEASKSKNSQAFEAARTILAKAIGENKLSNEDIRRTGIDPRLVQGALDWVNKKIEGVPNEDIIKQMYAVSTALRNKSASRINEQADRAQEAAKASNFKGNLQLYFPKISVNIPPTKGGGAYDDAAKEARYQEYKRKQGQ
jgi:hypothetical protein